MPAPALRPRPARPARPGGRPAGPGHPRLPRHRPHHHGAAPRPRPGRLARPSLAARHERRRQGQHHGPARQPPRTRSRTSARQPDPRRRLEPRRHVRARARLPRARTRSARWSRSARPFSGDLKTNTNVREFYERIAGHDVNLPPFERIGGKPPVPTLALWSRKDGIVAPAAARGLAHEVDKAVEIDTHHMGFAVYRPALSRRWSARSGQFLTSRKARRP